MTEQSFKITLRKPNPGEFGYNFCQDSILYMASSMELKPLSWFLGGSDSMDLVAWMDSNGQTGRRDLMVPSSLDYNIYLGSSIIDGSWPVDDMEVKQDGLRFALPSPTDSDSVPYASFLGLFSTLRDMGSNSIALPVLTERLTQEDMMKEMMQQMSMDGYFEFEAIFSAICGMRHEGTGYKAQRALILELTGKKVAMKSGLASAKTDLFNEIKAKCGSASPTLLDLAPDLSADEVVSIFHDKCMGNIKAFINGRALMDAAVENMTTLNEGDELHLGKVQTSKSGKSVPDLDLSSLAVVLFDSTSSDGLMMLNMRGGTHFDLHCMSELESKSVSNYGGKTDRKNIEFSLGALDNATKGTAATVDTIAGTASGIPTKDLDTVLEKIYVQGSARKKNIQAAVVDSNVSTKSVLAGLKSTVKLGASMLPTKFCFRFSPSTIAMPKCTGVVITGIDDRILEVEAKRSKTDPDNFTRVPGSIEKRLGVVSERLARIYDVAEPYLIAYLKFILGMPQGDTPFIMVGVDQVSADTFDHTLGSRGTSDMCDSFYGVEEKDAIGSLKGMMLKGARTRKASGIATITASPSMFAKFAGLVDTSGGLDAFMANEKVYDICRGFRTMKKKGNEDDIFRALAKALPSVKPSEDSIFATLEVEKLCDHKHMFALLMECCVQLHTRDGVMIDFKGGLDKVMEPRHIISSCMQSGCFSLHNMVVSVYG